MMALAIPMIKGSYGRSHMEEVLIWNHQSKRQWQGAALRPPWCPARVRVSCGWRWLQAMNGLRNLGAFAGRRCSHLGVRLGCGSPAGPPAR